MSNQPRPQPPGTMYVQVAQGQQPVPQQQQQQMQQYVQVPVSPQFVQVPTTTNTAMNTGVPVRVVYSNPATPNTPVLITPLNSGAPPPLILTPSYNPQVPVSPSQAFDAVPTNTGVPGCADCEAHAKAGNSAQSVTPASLATQKNWASHKHSWEAANATRREAEHWVSHLLHVPLEPLRALPTDEFQEMIQTALRSKTDDTTTRLKMCPIHLTHAASSGCVPVARRDRRTVEQWLHAMLRIPGPVLQAVAASTLDDLVECSLRR